MVTGRVAANDAELSASTSRGESKMCFDPAARTIALGVITTRKRRGLRTTETNLPEGGATTTVARCDGLDQC